MMKLPMNFAHRGFSGKYPENSRCAFVAAVEQTKAVGFESDVHLTRDGKAVITHDAVLERTSNGSGWIKDHSYEELCALDFGAWMGEEFKGQKIMLFSELLDFCRDTNMLLNLEIKNYEVFYHGIEQVVIDEIRRYKMQDSVFLSSFNHISMEYACTLDGDIKMGLLYDKPVYQPLKYFGKMKSQNMHPRYLLLQYQPELIGQFKDMGKGVHTWTVNTQEDMKSMIDLGVDTIITNYPDLLDSVLADYQSPIGV